MKVYGHHILRLLAILSYFLLISCQSKPDVVAEARSELPWFNPTIFPGIDLDSNSMYSVSFDTPVPFSSSDNKEVTVKDCVEVITLSEKSIAPSEYIRWQLIKDDCEILDWFYRAPDNSVSHWEKAFGYDLLKTFPATAVPDLGGQGLDGRSGSLKGHEPNLEHLETGGHNVKIKLDDMVVDYTLMARGDFNRDGNEDLFVRLSWYIENTFGDGYDWVVLTKLSPDAAPVMLWRK